MLAGRVHRGRRPAAWRRAGAAASDRDLEAGERLDPVRERVCFGHGDGEDADGPPSCAERCAARGDRRAPTPPARAARPPADQSSIATSPRATSSRIAPGVVRGGRARPPRAAGSRGDAPGPAPGARRPPRVGPERGPRAPRAIPASALPVSLRSVRANSTIAERDHRHDHDERKEQPETAPKAHCRTYPQQEGTGRSRPPWGAAAPLP